MRKRFRVMLRIILVLIVLISIVLVAYLFVPREAETVYKEIDKIEKYGYILEDRDSELMQDTFSKLKNVLAKDEIDYNLYAEYLSELFIIDLFTLENKNNKYDVGGKDYVLPEAEENFELNVEDTLYKYLESKDGNSRGGEYPQVTNISLTSIEETKYSYNKEESDGYKLILEWDYDKDLDYPNKGEVIAMLKDEHLYVVSYKGVE